MNIIDYLYSFYYGFSGKKSIFGKTVLNKPIPCFYVGNKKPIIIVQGSIHAREYITSYLILEQIRYCKKYEALLNGTICFVPMLNIDGVELVLNEGLNLKANYNLVDLNVNFDANFGKGKTNVFEPNLENYIGLYPFSEPETYALKCLTEKVKPNLTISYHSKGEEIYWYYSQTYFNLKLVRHLAERTAIYTKYKMAYSFNSHGGYKDWCALKLGIPALTIEVGDNNLTHPIKEDSLWSIIKHNLTTPKNLLKDLATQINTI